MILLCVAKSYKILRFYNVLVWKTALNLNRQNFTEKCNSKYEIESRRYSEK